MPLGCHVSKTCSFFCDMCQWECDFRCCLVRPQIHGLKVFLNVFCFRTETFCDCVAEVSSVGIHLSVSLISFATSRRARETNIRNHVTCTCSFRHSRGTSKRHFWKHCFKSCFHSKLMTMWCGWLAMSLRILHEQDCAHYPSPGFR